jgi:hypothetical protein
MAILQVYELLMRRQRLISELPFINHMSRFNSNQGCAGTMKCFKPHHRFSYFVNKAMVLRYDIIERLHFECVNKAE